jgi:hypothetical protein
MDLNQKHASRLLPILAGQINELLVINMTLIGAYVAYSMFPLDLGGVLDPYGFHELHKQVTTIPNPYNSLLVATIFFCHQACIVQT